VFAGASAEPFSPASESLAPGTHTLPVVNSVSDHPLLDPTGKQVNLLDLKKGKLAVASLIYTSCPETIGCPLAMAVLQQLDRLLAERPQLAKQVTLFLISFDPERDTPERMGTLRASLNPRSEWHFLTSASNTELTPLLEDFNQPVAKISNENGIWSGRFHHVFKVFLLDEANNIRNIYSVGFASPQLIMNDIETLTGEGKQ
jgi:cytochrome oxidase Cu insertion factor (SCO1/SenC/PrrC family)